VYRKLLSSALRTFVIFEKLPRFLKEHSFLKKVGEFLQNYMALRFGSDFRREHDENINGAIFFEVKMGLYCRTEIISVVKFWNMALETEAVHVPGRGISK